MLLTSGLWLRLKSVAARGQALSAQLLDLERRLQDHVAVGERPSREPSEQPQVVRAGAETLRSSLADFPGVVWSRRLDGSPGDFLGGRYEALWRRENVTERGDVLERLRSVDSEQRVARFDLELDGVSFDVSVEPLSDSYGGCLLVALDVTERRTREESRLQVGLADAQRVEALGLLAGGVAHDLNNLLVGVLANAALVLEETPDDSPQAAMLSSILQSAQRASELTRGMLSYAGRGRGDVRPHDLSVVARETVQLLSAYGSKKVHVQLELADALPPIDCESAQLRQLVMNLVTNAIDAVGDQEGRVLIRTRLIDVGQELLSDPSLRGDLKQGRYVSLEVEDTGDGMSAEVQARMFDPFFTTKPRGHGLGMSSVLGSMRSHGGALTVNSTPGEGTAFRVMFPRSNLELRHETTKQRQALRVEGYALIADDEPEVRRVAARILKRIGFELLEAHDGASALEHFEQSGPRISLVLLDVNMPKMSGVEVLSAIRAADPELPVVLTSGYPEQGLEHVLSQRTRFLQKPYTPNDLVKCVAVVMSGWLNAVESQARLRPGAKLVDGEVGRQVK
ncbi:MAG: response regulator [Polyangiaceae bacterium]|nr:response regulator [Myxococcales bacterium]MCB9588149.1 response regulator [Polyangiaceae bacterium]